jgi:tRNA(fMet)-specific endonuclease VapC
MIYILDTNICIYLLNGNKKIESKIKSTGIYSIAITYTILSELYFGAYNSNRVKENVSRIDDFKRNLTVLQEDAESSRIFGKIKAELKSGGNLVEDFDILIASIALANDCIIVTNNESHFKRIKNLSVVNWYK